MTDIDTSVSIAGPEDGEAWDRVVHDAAEGQVYHLFGWKEHFETVFGHQCYYLIARNGNDRAVGVLPLVHLNSRLFGNFFVSVPCFNYCGILAESDGVFHALARKAEEVAARAGATHVELRHRGDIRSQLPARRDKVSFTLALPESENELWRSFSSKLRSQIRRPEKEGVNYTHGGAELLEDFYEVFSHNMRDLGTPVYPARLFEDICTRFGDRATVFVVKWEGRPVASSLTIGFRDTLEVPFASSLRKYNRFSPNMGLYWAMMQFGIRSGFRIFDFGRSTVDSGPYRFKKQWGAEPTDLAWHYILTRPGELPQINPDNPKFRFAVNLWQRLPVAVANYLGPRVVKHLP